MCDPAELNNKIDGLACASIQSPPLASLLGHIYLCTSLISNIYIYIVDLLCRVVIYAHTQKPPKGTPIPIHMKIYIVYDMRTSRILFFQLKEQSQTKQKLDSFRKSQPKKTHLVCFSRSNEFKATASAQIHLAHLVYTAASVLSLGVYLMRLLGNIRLKHYI